MEQNILKYAARLEFDKICSLVCEYAVCEQAKEQVVKNVPQTELYLAQQQLDLTDELYIKLSQNSNPSISSVSEISEIAMRAEKGGVLSMGELLRVRTMLRNARNLKAWFDGDDEASFAAGNLFYLLYEDNTLERAINDSILSDSEMSDDASSELQSIRKKIGRQENAIRDKLDGMIHSTSTQKYLQDAIVTMRGGRFVVPVKQEHKNEIKGLVHDVSSSGSTYFVEPAAVVEANNQIMQLKGEEMQEIERILSAFTAQVGEIARQLVESYNAFVDIDVALAKAKYAIQLSATKPQLNDAGRIVLKKARHPLISKDKVVPIDVALGTDYNILVITGPNTGGKTVTLKTVGLLSLMAMSGMLVPAAERSELCVFNQVLVDIGDEQSIEQSLSTFSGHIKNTASILETADEQSLVLLDELGAGTDPAEGAALATAILDRLRGYGSRVIATTHYGELKMYALDTEGVQNASCEFDVATLRPTYKLNIGIPGRSNALLIGEKLGLDEALIESAKRNMSAEERRFEDVLHEIERLKSDLARREEEIEEKQQKAEELLQKGQAEYDRMIAEGQRDMDVAKLKARQLSADVTANANKLLDEIKKIEKDREADTRESRQRARAIAHTEAGRLHDLSGPEIDSKADNLDPVDAVKTGDEVYVVALAQVGTALTDADSKGNVEIQAGSIKTRVHIKDLRKPAATTPKPAKKPSGMSKASVGELRSGKNEINLLGKTVDEAVLEVERFIDAAVLSKLMTVYLIHGKGTGALRSGIQQYLKTNRHVKRFRLGGYGEGDSGVTIVELK